MAKRKIRRLKSKKHVKLSTSRHTNVPRFLVMLAVGVLFLLYTFYYLARQEGMLGDETPQDPREAPVEAPAAPQ